jgi:hypothetical protein
VRFHALRRSWPDGHPTADLRPLRAGPPPPSVNRMVALVLGLLVLSPVCAEYLSAYDTSTGNPVALLGGLIVLAPLYGAPALLIREVARRRGTGWPGVLAFALAAGVLQAGVVDQSLFSSDYRGISWWPEVYRATEIPGLGISAYLSTTFLAGHVLWSFTIPILLIEQLAPARARTPWLRTRGLVVLLVLYLLAAGLVLGDHLQQPGDHAAAVQVAGALLVAAVLIGVGLRAGGDPPDRPGPPRAVAAALGLAVGAVANLAPATWPGVVLIGAGLVVLLAVPRQGRWPDRALAATGAGILLALAAAGAVNGPIGHVPTGARVAHHVGAVTLVLVLGVLATRPRRAVPAPSISP